MHIIFYVSLLLSLSSHFLAQSTDSMGMQELKDMASNVSTYHNNLMIQMGSGNKGSFTMPAAFANLLNSSIVSPSLANLIRSASVQGSGPSSPATFTSIMSSDNLLLDPVQAAITAASLGVAAQACGLASGEKLNPN